MTDAFQCDGCGEFYHDAFRFVDIQLNTDAIRPSDFTFDDMLTEVFEIAPDDLDGGHEGNLCVACGIEALEELADHFGHIEDPEDAGE
jgi:hypothetical protein